MGNDLKEILKGTKNLQKVTKVLLQTTKAFSEVGGIISSDEFKMFPINKKGDWVNAVELGTNILGLRIGLQSEIKFHLKAVSKGFYKLHYHDVTEKITVLSGKVIFNFPQTDSELIVLPDSPLTIPPYAQHSAVVEEGSEFIVEFY